MAYYINGIGISYDYEELIAELKEDIEDEIIQNTNVIHIVRDKKPIEGTEYYPIIDFYYLDDYEIITAPLDDLYNREDYSEEEWKLMEQEQIKEIEQYKKDEPFFEKATVLGVLTEMETWNSII